MLSNQRTKSQFNEAQVSLLRILDRPISEQEVAEIKDLLVDYFDKKLHNQVADDIVKNDINEKHFTALRKGIKPKEILKKRDASRY